MALQSLAPAVLISGLLACLAGPLTQAAHAEPAWTTYHRDPERSGFDSNATQPIEPAFAWQTEDLGAPIWGQPLVLGERVYVATVGDGVYALDASTGKVVWHESVGTPVPSGELPCGDIEPTVGIVGTPVTDASTKVVYIVADTWDVVAKQAHHVLKGLSLADGTVVLSTTVDPPGSDPKALLQHTALNLDRGNIIFGFGGNDGDCSDYQGTVVAAPENGGQPRFWQYHPEPPSKSGGAVWATSGPAIDSTGTIYATTGNPNPPSGQQATTFDYSDSVVKLDPATDFVAEPASEPAPLGWFEPPSWLQDSNNDTDLGSAGAELLPGGVLFQAGKNGTGYLIDEATMGSGAAAVYEAQVCAGAGSFGGDAFANGVIYIPCTNGVQALSYDEQARTFTPLWQRPSDAFGPPIVSGGLVWVVATGGFNGKGTKLYGLDPATGAPRYTETLPSPVEDHFASPSAAGGRLFVATGSSVTGYQIAQLSSGEETGKPGPCSSNCPPNSEPKGSPSASSTAAGTSGGSTSTSGGAHPSSDSTTPLLLSTRLHAVANGRLRLALGCPGASSSCQGTVILQAKFVVTSRRAKRHVRHVVLITLASARFGPAKGNFTIAIRLGSGARAHLRRHHNRLALQVVISSPGSKARHVAAVLT
jgi:outer membrane protein assembly factor BamB